MVFQLVDYQALGSVNDLIIPTLTPEYLLGQRVVGKDRLGANSEYPVEFIYIKNTQLDPMNAFQPIVLRDGIIDESEIFGIINPASQTATVEIVGVPQVEIPLDSYGFVQIKGNALCFCEALFVEIVIGDELHYSAGLPGALREGGGLTEGAARALEGILSGGSDGQLSILLKGNLVGIGA